MHSNLTSLRFTTQFMGYQATVGRIPTTLTLPHARGFPHVPAVWPTIGSTDCSPPGY